MINALKQKLYPLVSGYVSRAVLLEGKLKGTGDTVRTLLVGNSAYMRYLPYRVYEETPVVIKKWRILNSCLNMAIQNLQKDLDLCVAEIPAEQDIQLKGLYACKGQEYVRQIIDTSGSWEGIRKRFHKKRRQIANGFSSQAILGYEISNKLEDLEMFYTNMHIPHIKRQYGNISSIDSFEEMKNFFLKGFLLFITMGGQRVAGALCITDNDTLVFRRTGVLDGNEQYVREGAQSALYYFLVRYANENRFNKLDTMKSRPFLKDGVYRHKREWGAAVCSDNEPESWVYYIIPAYSEKVIQFFEKNPVIIHTQNGLVGLVGITDVANFTSVAGKELIRQFYAPGLEGLLVFMPDSEAPVEFLFKGENIL